MPTQYECDIVFLVPGKNFSQRFINSWTKTIIFLEENKYSYMFCFSYAPIISSVRNGLLGNLPLLENVLNPYETPLEIFNNQVICKTVIMIDSDMVWGVEDIEKLIHSPYDVIVGPYVLTDKKRTSIKLNNKFFNVDELIKFNEPFEIEAAGLGFTACKFEVLKKLSYPWFKTTEIIYEYENGSRMGSTLGEDVYFFNQITAAGHKIYCDPTIKLGHEKSTTFTL